MSVHQQLSLRERHQDHKSLVLWATECAEHVLPYFEADYPEDARPRKAIEAGRAWVRDEIATSKARATAFAAHAAARAADDIAACAAARAAGHAAATTHVAGHARHAADYAVTAAEAAGIANEREWQYQRLPEHLRSIAFPPEVDAIYNGKREESGFGRYTEH